MIPKDPINKTFYLINKIDHLPVLITNTSKIIENFQFALRIDPFLYLQLLHYCNLEGYGFKNKITMIEEIPLILDENILEAAIKSNVSLSFHKNNITDIIYYLLIYPAYLTITELLLSPFWLSEEELNILCIMPTGNLLRKLFFPQDHDNIIHISKKKRISYLTAESELGIPKSTLLTNIYLVNKHIPLNIPSFTPDLNLISSLGKMTFIVELLDCFLKTGYYVKNKQQLLIEFINQKLDISISLDNWFEILMSKINLLFHYLLPEDLKNQVSDFIKKNYDGEKKREKSRNKISVPQRNQSQDAAVLEEI